MPERWRKGVSAGALGARVGGQADELGALFPQAPCEVVVLGLVAGGDHLLVFDVLPGESGGMATTITGATGEEGSSDVR